jgi:hypothetical protein
VLAALVASASTLLAVALKSRCGVPAPVSGLYEQLCYSDIVPLWTFERLDVGAVPYLDHPVEYPPLTGLVMWLTALPSSTAGQFLAANAVVLVAAAALTGWLLGRHLGLRRALVFAAAPTLMVSGAVNWDLPSVALATAGLVAHRRGRDGAAGALLGLGAAAKAWPALLVPGLVLGAWRLRGTPAALHTLGWSVAAWALVNVPVAVLAPRGWWRFFELSRERAIDWDSLWRVVPLRLGLAAVGEANTLIAAVTLLGIAVLLVVAVRTTPPASWHLVGLPVVAWFLLVGKVWSPQFTLWLLPPLAVAAPGLGGLAALAVTDVAVTATRFPFLGTLLGVEGGSAEAFEWAVLARAAVVAWLAWTAWRRAAGRLADPSPGRPGGTGGAAIGQSTLGRSARTDA